jgi:hypothetical protein
MTDQNQLAEEKAISAIREDCLRQAETAQTKLNEVVECLTDENHLGALGTFAGLDEDIVGLKVFLTRIARLTVGQTTPIASHAQPKPTPHKRRHE